MARLPFVSGTILLTVFALTTLVFGRKFDASLVDYNLNRNRSATSPFDYWGSRQDDEPDFKYAPSPDNWRVPFYTIFLDRFVNGDPSNDDIYGTPYETDMMSTQLRFGGDLEGLKDSLDYIAGMGIKVPRIAGLLCYRKLLTNKEIGSLYRRLSFCQPAMGRRFVLGAS